MTYDFRTGELSDERVCRYCGTLSRIVPDFAAADYHERARCVEPVEPIRDVSRLVDLDSTLGSLADDAMRERNDR